MRSGHKDVSQEKHMKNKGPEQRAETGEDRCEMDRGERK